MATTNTRVDVNVAFTVNGFFQSKIYTFMMDSTTHILKVICRQMPT